MVSCIKEDDQSKFYTKLELEERPNKGEDEYQQYFKQP